MTTTKTMNLKAAFELMKPAVKYVVLDGYTGLPFQVKRQPIAILTDSEKAWQNILPLFKKEGRIFRLDTDTPVDIEIFETGKSVFPPQWESRLLTSRELYSDCVYVPEQSMMVFSRLYRELFHSDKYDDDPDRQIMKRVVTDRVGMPVRPRYRSIEWHGK